MSPSNSSSSPKNDQRLNAIVVAAQEKRNMTSPIQVSPQEVVPEMNNLKKVSPQEVMPQVKNPEQTSPKEIVPEVDNLKQVSPQEVVPEVNNSKQGSPQEQVSQEVVPEVNNPKQVSPQEVVNEVNNPKKVSSQELVPEVNNPIQVSPQEVVPDLNNPQQGSPQEVVPEYKKRSSFELHVLRTINKLMKKYPSLNNHALICNICKRGFPNAHSLCSHQKTHKHDLELEWKMKHVDPSHSHGQCFRKKKPDNSYQGMSNSVDVGGSSQDTLSNDHKRLGISPGSVRNMDEVMGYPSAPPYGKTNYGFPLVTHNYYRSNLSDNNRSGLYFDPFMRNGGGSNSNYPSLVNGGFTMAPTPATPYRPFIVNPSSGPRDSTIMNPSNTLGSCSNNNNSSSQGEISLELTLGPSKWMGGSNNNNSSVHPSLKAGVTGGGSMDLNMPLRPIASRNHFYSTNPLARVTRNVPPPCPVTSLPNDEDVPSSSSLKEKNHDADQPGRS
ncbi:unnamed protein product [Eruca vesicaria subsp. sativa]|uniref:C2H2-type domain-containing protein n=1 Tax=Eruca vesicaria subsp. sativa TaxID=29727 RepID=A0ABC8KWZ5_ERUVS|nr:unnamed protein product [Eruca vesicaria subsp. sativa]